MTKDTQPLASGPSIDQDAIKSESVFVVTFGAKVIVWLGGYGFGRFTTPVVK